MRDEKNSEDKWKGVMERISALEDLQNITQLDIINLKNEIERIKLSSPSPVPPEIEEKIIELEKIARDVETFRKWKQTVEEVKFLRSRIMETPPPAKEIEKIRDEIRKVREEMERGKISSPPIDITSLRDAIEENRKTIEELKNMIKAGGKIPDLGSVKKMVNENRKLVESLKARLGSSFSGVPPEAHGELETLRSEIDNLESEIRKLKEERPEEEAKDEIDSLRKELFTKLEELNEKFGKGDSEKLMRIVEANRASIERLKSLISGEDIRKELEENRKFMNELKKLLGGRKRVAIPPDHEMRRKMLALEQKVEALGRKLEKMNRLKPIKLPELPPPPKTTKTADLEKMRKDIDRILSKMGDFVTKDEVEKGILEKRVKTDQKLITEEIEKELNEIKKAIIRNEDQITSVASDVEGLKKEVGTIEKREWGKVSELPEIGEIKERIKNLEKRIESLSSGPVFIE